MKKIAIVFNPTSGGGRGQAQHASLMAELKKRSDFASLTIADFATSPRQDSDRFAPAGEAVIKALQWQPDVIVTIGGDGTLSETTHALFSLSDSELVTLTGTASALAPIAYVTAGSGSDFGRGKMSQDDKAFLNSYTAKECVEAIFDGAVHPVDVGFVYPLRNSDPTSVAPTAHDEKRGHTGIRYFINVASLSLGPHVVVRAERYKNYCCGWPCWRGCCIFNCASLGGFCCDGQLPLKCRVLPVPSDVNLDPRDEENMKSIVSQVSMPTPEFDTLQSSCLAIANSSHFGHGFYISPDARCDDGKLNMTNVDAGVCRFLCCGLVCGHAYNEKVSQWPTTTLREGQCFELRCDEEAQFETDGELGPFLPALAGVVAKRKLLLKSPKKRDES